MTCFPVPSPLEHRCQAQEWLQGKAGIQLRGLGNHAMCLTSLRLSFPTPEGEETGAQDPFRVRHWARRCQEQDDLCEPRSQLTRNMPEESVMSSSSDGWQAPQFPSCCSPSHRWETRGWRGAQELTGSGPHCQEAVEGGLELGCLLLHPDLLRPPPPGACNSLPHRLISGLIR